MAGDDRGIFRQESLERLSSPERLDQLVQLADRRSWLPLAAAALVVGCLVAWAVFGRVPVNVHGRGILIHPRTVSEISAPGSGRLLRLEVAVGDELRPGQTLARIALPELEKQLELQRQKSLELTAVARAAEVVETGRDASRTGDAGLERHIDESREVASRLRREALESLVEERRILGRQLARARDLADALERQWRRQQGLQASGDLSEQQVLDAEGAYLDGQLRVSELETRLLELKTHEIEIDDRYLARLQGLADMRLDLQDYEQQASDAQRRIAELEARLDVEGRVVSEQGGTLLEIHVAPGQFVAVGQRIGTMTVGDSTTPLRSVVYFTVGDGKRIAVGDAIQVTPDTVERARFGGIEAVVRSVSGLAVTTDEATNFIGNRAIAADILDAGYRIQVVADLLRDPETPSGLKWSTSRGPDFPVSAGTTTTARVAVEERKPLAFVLPALKSATGAD